ncbi:MAG: hypothetical protein KGL97_04180, partial [Alphaproteobacteria bacterium]|nr:hypothetical protein [Alphaproteobacteria bacterium]
RGMFEAQRRTGENSLRRRFCRRDSAHRFRAKSKGEWLDPQIREARMAAIGQKTCRAGMEAMCALDESNRYARPMIILPNAAKSGGRISRSGMLLQAGNRVDRLLRESFGTGRLSA